ncbi:MAG TPA: phosphoadenosine phosphosulfate reductase family protein [Baekduia sp.]|nr:phosphoadenosine phosphosulfate reductase family protein [Baekduia sp.]
MSTRPDRARSESHEILSPLPAVDGEKLLHDAIAEHEPSHIFALYSGGNDSAVACSFTKRAIGDLLDAAVFIDTGTALPGVREHVETTTAARGLRLIVLEAGDAFFEMVAKHGVPGPGAHRYPYVNLKERQVDRLIREHKTRWNDRIMLVSGVRRSESDRRMGTAEPTSRDGCTVWANPLIDWTNAEMRTYRERNGIEPSDAAALMHRSGECNCGAFAAPGEREMLRDLYPDWFERVVVRAERIARRHGKHDRWGERPPGATPDDDATGPLCRCQTYLEIAA